MIQNITFQIWNTKYYWRMKVKDPTIPNWIIYIISFWMQFLQRKHYIAREEGEKWKLLPQKQNKKYTKTRKLEMHSVISFYEAKPSFKDFLCFRNSPRRL